MTNIAIAETPILVKLMTRLSNAFASEDHPATDSFVNAGARAEMTQAEEGVTQMKDMADDISGLAQHQSDFLEALKYQEAMIAAHILSAWEGETLEDVNDNLEAARTILETIGTRAASFGFAELAAAAHDCEDELSAHLEGPDADLAICPGEIVYHMDLFVSQCSALVQSQTQ